MQHVSKSETFDVSSLHCKHGPIFNFQIIYQQHTPEKIIAVSPGRKWTVTMQPSHVGKRNE